jgi:hypothetical protein
MTSIPQYLPEVEHSFKKVILDIIPFTFSLIFPDFIHEGRIFQFISKYGEYALDKTSFGSMVFSTSTPSQRKPTMVCKLL